MKLKFVRLKKRTIVLITLGFIVGYIFIVNYSIKWTNNLKKEYPSLEWSDTVNGILQSHFINVGATYLSIDDTIKFRVYDFKNISTPKVYIGNFIQYGDIIKKNAYSDTIYVYRNNNQYCFVPAYFPYWSKY